MQMTSCTAKASTFAANRFFSLEGHYTGLS